MTAVSVIIVNWNGKEVLVECLRSLAREAKGVENLQIIVVDNASNDGSLEAVACEFPSVKTLSNKHNVGFAKANNIGLRCASGEYVCLINSDIVVKPGCLKAMCDYMEEHTSVGLLGPQILNSSGTLQPSCKRFPTLWNTFCRALALDSLFGRLSFFSGYLMSSFAHDEIRSVDILSGCFFMARREALNEVGFLDERFFIYAEDKDWCKRFWEEGWEVIYFPYGQAIHHGGKSSSKAPLRFFLEMQRAQLQYFRKHHNKLELATFYLLLLLHQLVRIVPNLFRSIIPHSGRNKVVLKMKTHAAAILWLLHPSRD